MNAKTLKHYRSKLIDLQKDLISRVMVVERELDQVEDIDTVEPMERIQASVLAESLDRLDDIEREQVDAIETALERIDQNKYGVCVDCGQEIPRPRLDAVPWAVRCEADQAQFEKERSDHLERIGGRPRG